MELVKNRAPAQKRGTVPSAARHERRRDCPLFRAFREIDSTPYHSHCHLHSHAIGLFHHLHCPSSYQVLAKAWLRFAAKLSGDQGIPCIIMTSVVILGVRYFARVRANLSGFSWQSYRQGLKTCRQRQHIIIVGHPE